MKRLRMVFCGTPQFAVPSLKHLRVQPDFEVVGVFTQPDRPRGRGQEVSFSPVKEMALEADLRVYQPEKIRAPDVEELLKALAPDVIVIIAYGQIIPARLLTVPRLGWINLHASLLPAYRGAAPINWAIANGETSTGNTTMRIDTGMDTGDTLLQQEVTIGRHETAVELTAQLAEGGALLMSETLRRLAAGAIEAVPQDHSQSSMAPMLKREDGLIDWQHPSKDIYNRMRGFAPWPGAYTIFRGQTCHLWGAPVSNETTEEAPGSLISHHGCLRVACGGDTLLELRHVKLEGRKQISAAEFANGARLQAGERLGKG